jgi:hypothetical protein
LVENPEEYFIQEDQEDDVEENLLNLLNPGQNNNQAPGPNANPMDPFQNLINVLSPLLSSSIGLSFPPFGFDFLFSFPSLPYRYLLGLEQHASSNSNETTSASATGPFFILESSSTPLPFLSPSLACLAFRPSRSQYLRSDLIL